MANKGNIVYMGQSRIGVKNYSALINFMKNEVVLTVNEEGTVKLYKSLINNNKGNPVTDEEKWEEVELGGGGGEFPFSIPLFSRFWSDYTLNNISFLKSSTFSWQSGDVYTSCYDHLAQEYNHVGTDLQKEYYYNDITANGNLIVNDRIISGFATNTIFANHIAKKPTSSFEYVVKVKLTSLVVNASFVEAGTGNKGLILRVVNATTGQVNMWTGTGSAWTLGGVNVNAPMIPNTWMWYKVVWENNTIYVSYSLDGKNYTQTYTSALALAIDWSQGFQGLGGCNWESVPFANGQIDLTECYLDIDGERYWEGCKYVRYYQAEDGHKICSAEEEGSLNHCLEITNKADYYVVDKTNKRFKLPRQNPKDNPLLKGKELYFFVGNYSAKAIEQTAGLNTELFNNKVDLDKMVEVTPIIDSFDNGVSGYHIYADGFCEQWARIEESGVNVVTINFLLPFKSIPMLLTAVESSNRTTFLDNNVDIRQVTTISFVKQYIANVGTGWCWLARGYLPEGTY